MQLGGHLGEIAANIALESQRNHCWFTLATKVALEMATKIAPKIACVNGPLHFQNRGWSTRVKSAEHGKIFKTIHLSEI